MLHVTDALLSLGTLQVAGRPVRTKKTVAEPGRGPRQRGNSRRRKGHGERRGGEQP